MVEKCLCRTLQRLSGPKAETYASRFLVDLSDDDDAGAVLSCRVCGAYWRAEGDVPDPDGVRDLILQRLESEDELDDALPAPDDE